VKHSYPFSAIVGQEQMKLALLLAAVDWRVSVLLRGDKGAGKTTTARGLASLLPEASPFINLPIGATEDRLLGGLDLERTLKGEPALKLGLVSEAHGGILYVDEINLLPAHLGDMLLDTAASGVNVVEREGFSVAHAAEFVLLGSMNPEEGVLRPQLLDRFALAVDIAAPMDAAERRTVVERRIAFEQDPSSFYAVWAVEEQQLGDRISQARQAIKEVACSGEMLGLVSDAICASRVRSLRADLAAVRASIAYAALSRSANVEANHVEAVLPLVLAHRMQDCNRSTSPPPPSKMPQSPSDMSARDSEDDSPKDQSEVADRVFKPAMIETAAIQTGFGDIEARGRSSMADATPGPVVGQRRTAAPREVDIRATVRHALAETGRPQVRVTDLHERVREPLCGTRYVLLIDSSGSHAAQERMRLVKGAAAALLTRSFRNGDEVVLIAFRGTSAQVLLEPTPALSEALAALEYLPTGGRTPLAHGLDCARNYISHATVLIVLTDGRANVPLSEGDGWQDALAIAKTIHTPSLVVDTEDSNERLGRSRILAERLNAACVPLNELELIAGAVLALRQSPSLAPS